MSEATIRAVVADDNRDWRALVRIWMENVVPTQYDVVGEADSGEGCRDLVELYKPDLLILDLTMPGTNTLELIEDLKARYPATDIVVLSGFEASRVEADVIARGAVGYLEKGPSGDMFRWDLDRLITASAHS